MHKNTNTKKLALAKTNIKRQNPGFIAFYDSSSISDIWRVKCCIIIMIIWPGNRADVKEES